MQSFITIFAALTALVIGVASVPVSCTHSVHRPIINLHLTEHLPASTAPATEPCDTTSYLRANQSYVFGWQLTGSAANSDDLDQTCSQLKSSHLSKWNQLGLLTSTIQTPVCNALTPNAQSALPRVAAANTQVFINYITNAFDKTNKTTYAYLCDSIRYVQLDGFLLDASLITNSTCQLGGGLLNPQPFTTNGGAAVNKSAVAAFWDAQSKQFAYTYAASASSSSDLDAQCGSAAQPVRQERLDALKLDASCVEATICSVKEPMSVEDAKGELVKWQSQGFLAVIQNISNQPGYQKWLCHNLNVEGLNDVGLDGKLVKANVCKVAFPGEDGSGNWN